jgi:diguanylate cyclase (GGDEF)-like protein
LAALISADMRLQMQNTLAEQLADADDIECVFSVRHKNGNVIWVLNRAVCQKAADGNEYIHGILVKITKLKRAYDSEKEVIHALEEEIKKDPLTRIYNASATRKLAKAYIEASAENAATLLVIDLDDFKQVNDKYGHMFGDVVLVQTAKILEELFRPEDIVGRIGGDEFMVLMKGAADLSLVAQLCRKLNESLLTMFVDQLPMCKPSCSIGIAQFPDHANSYFDLFSCADRALYYAKVNGKQQYVVFDSSNDSITNGGSALRYTNYDKNTLRSCIERNKALPFGL